jgi:uncharacterized protein
MSHPSSIPSFVVPLRDLDDGPKTLEGEITPEWLRQALAETEATPAGHSGQLSLQLSKSGREVLVRGRARVQVVMPCARTLAPITLDLEPEVVLLLQRADAPGARPAPAPKRMLASRSSAGAPAGRKATAGAPKGERLAGERAGPHHRPRGREVTAPARRRGGWDGDIELSGDDAAQDTFQGEQIVLDPFVREFILLELPMFPVRQDLPSLPVDARASAPGSTAEPSASDNDPATTSGDARQPRPLDPRLAPLAELKHRLQQNKKDKE